MKEKTTNQICGEKEIISSVRDRANEDVVDNSDERRYKADY